MAVHLRGGPPAHPLVYEKRIHRFDAGVESGDIVPVKTREGVVCGHGIVHRSSRIGLRMLTFRPDEVPDENWLALRLKESERVRTELLGLPEQTDSWRVVHAEADGISGLIIDRYQQVAVVSLFSLAWARRQEMLDALLREVLGVSSVVFRVDDKTATQEGIELQRQPRVAPLEIHEHGVRFLVDPQGGHKTGFFLDQRDGRRHVMRLARGRRVFDGMTYTGGFALAAAKGGASQVVAMDLDENAVAAAKANIKRNGLAVDARHGDVFDALRTLSAAPDEQKPELLIIDPAKWARDRKGLGAALHRYRDLNRLAMTAVHPDGMVLTHSCSGLVSEEAFLQVIRDAALDTQRHVRFLDIRGAAPDHPVAAHVPEGRYLKAVLVSVGQEFSGPGRGQPDGEGRPPRNAREGGGGAPRGGRPRRPRSGHDEGRGPRPPGRRGPRR